MKDENQYPENATKTACDWKIETRSLSWPADYIVGYFPHIRDHMFMIVVFNMK